MDDNVVIVTAEESGERVDALLARHLEGFSRSAVQRLIEGGAVLLGGKAVKKNTLSAAGDRFFVTLPELADIPLVPQDIPLDVVYEDGDVIVLAGHLHTTELTEVMTDEGRITQVIASSVWAPESRARSKPYLSGPTDYGARQETAPGQDRFAEYRPAMTRYLRSSLAGYMRMEVGARGVTMRVYGGASSSPAHVWRLR